MTVHCSFEHFRKNKEYNAINWLHLALLDKATKEKDELRDTASWLQLDKNGLKVYKYALGQTFLSYKCKIKLIEKSDISSFVIGRITGKRSEDIDWEIPDC